MSGTASKRVYGKLTIVSDGLTAGSAPLECGAEHDPDRVALKRRVHCRRYDNCLTYAAAAGWLGFHCGACDVDELLTREEWLSDLEGMTRFLLALSGR
jgi:hypothetical protein